MNQPSLKTQSSNSPMSQLPNSQLLHVDDRPLRVLHVLGGTGCGGSEAWVVGLLRHAGDETESTILVHSDVAGRYEAGHCDEEIRTYGGRIVACRSTKRPVTYARNFRRILREHGPFDIVHSHVALFSGFALKLAHQQRVPVRIAHSHCARVSTSENTRQLPRRLYVSTMQRWVARHATHRVAASPQAVHTLDSKHPGAPWQVLPCGVDLTDFAAPNDSRQVRKSLGIDDKTFVLGHVGRLVDAKNHRFLLETLAELKAWEVPCCLLLVGDGELRASLEQYATQLGVQSRVKFLGVRSDVAMLLSHAIDLFVFPSKHEGLGLALVEAQAASLPCLVSANVPPQATVVPRLVHRLSLADGPGHWARAIQAAKQERPSETVKQDVLRHVEQSDFSIQTSAGRLHQLYRSAIRESGPGEVKPTGRRHTDALHKEALRRLAG